MDGKQTVGCLYLDGLEGHAGSAQAPGLPGVALRPFTGGDGSDLWEQLQSALQRLRARWGECGILARGEGCGAALALAEQLPVERLVLLEPEAKCASADAALRRQARRMAAFARRNLPLCVSDMLIVRRGEPGRRALPAGFGRPVNSRVLRLYLRGTDEKELYTIREITVKQVISCFLHTGELPKPLAQRHEMCIIYG